MKILTILAILVILLLSQKYANAQTPYYKERGDCIHYYSGNFPNGREDLIHVICRDDLN